ncbi:MAG TPA: exonuclease sbcCD subunit D, partial [Clostridiaceae bacterium]|nr:exonuclease sbcCD subunit D [Clostridiaceae bacterium]
RPLSVGGSGAVDPSVFKGFDYTALGHLHNPQKVGCEEIRYSGSLMKYSFDEAKHKKCVYIVDMDQYGKVNIKGVELKPRRDIRCIEGCLDELKKGPKPGENKDDYIMATVKDKKAILDVYGQLRCIYPNLLHVERPQYDASGNICSPGENYKKMNDVDLFSSFYKQVTDNEISKEQGETLKELLDKYYQELREA